MRLKPAHAKRQADIAEVGRDVVVQRLNFFDIVGFSFSQFGGAGANLLRWLAAIFLETCVPASHLFPARERSHLHGGRLGLLRCLLLFLFFVLILVVIVNVRAAPGVNATAVLLCNLWIFARLGLQLDDAVLWDVEFKLLIQHGAALREIIL